MKYFIALAAVLGCLTTQISATVIDTSLLAYYIPTHQNSSLKSDTTVIGTYGYFGFGQNSLELEYDNVLDSSLKSSTQTNYIGTYTYYGMPYKRLKAGLHHINSSSAGADILILGAAHDEYNYYGYKLWSVGCDAFASNYTNFNVYQVAPYFITTFQPSYQSGYFELTTKTNLINISGSNHKTMNHMETNLRYIWNAFSLGCHVWTGESQYGVYEGGAVVYNSADTLRDGYAITGTYTLTTKINLTASYLYQRMQESTTGTDTSFNKYTLMLGYHL